MTRAEKITLMKRHLALNIGFYGDAAVVLFRKHAARYISDSDAERDLRLAMLTCETPDQLETIIDEYETDSVRAKHASPLPVTA